MSKTWNDCIEIYKDGDFVDDIDVDRSIFTSWQRYVNIICHEPNLNVWYDTKAKCCFGSEQDFYSNPNDFSFFAQKENFVTNRMWGINHVADKFGNHLGNNAIVKDDYILQDLPELKKFKGKKILIVGGGPTAKDINWQDAEFDYVWSCTKFYLNEDLNNVGVDLATIGGNVDLNDAQFNEFLNNHNTICGFECGVSPFKSPEDMVQFKEKYPNRIFYYHPRYFSKLGSAARLLCLGTFLGAEQVSFVGFDGNPVGKKHAFEGESKVHNEPWRNDATNDLYRRQLVLLWDYLLQFDTKFQNLGEEHPANQSSDISKKMFPLGDT